MQETQEELKTEVPPTPQVETFEETRSRLLQEIPFIPGGVESPTDLSIRYMFNNRGDYPKWSFWYRNDFPADAHQLDIADASDKELVDEAIRELPNDEITVDIITKYLCWWRGGPTELEVEDDVEGRLLDYMRVGNNETGQSLDVLNCSSEELSPKEQELISNTIQSVANFTGNKIFEHVRGVLMSKSDRFQSNSVGAYMPTTKIIRINIDWIRDKIRSSQENPRYDKYIGSGHFFEATLAHELGHAMDITTLSEAKKAGIQTEGKHTSVIGDTTADFSLFDDQFGWVGGNVVRDSNGRGTRDWHIDPALEIECHEFSPTSYGTVNPKEDFAETFAIMALGGRRDLVPLRATQLAEGLQTLYGANLHGPFLLQADYRPAGSLYRPTLPSKILVNTAVSAEVLAKAS